MGEPGITVDAVAGLLDRAPRRPGGPAADGSDSGGREDALGAWLRGQSGRHVHASSTCRIGTTVDPSGRVRTGDGGTVDGLYVADLSVLPDVPTANPMLAALLVGEVVAGHLLHRT